MTLRSGMHPTSVDWRDALMHIALLTVGVWVDGRWMLAEVHRFYVETGSFPPARRNYSPG